MRIQQSQVQLTGQHVAARQHSAQMRLHMATTPATARPNAEQVELSAAGKAAQQNEMAFDLRSQLANHPLWQLIQQLIKKLTGRELSLDDIVAASPRQPSADKSASKVALAVNGVEWQLELHAREEFHESEHTRFTAGGNVTSADGRQIEFSASLELYREFHQVSEITLSASSPAVKKDPLVLNYAATSANLTANRINFDLDADGSEDRIASLAKGSGFLAQDQNEDGQINDGRELFGAQTGNGFVELAQHDADGNGWIDQSDPVWAKLSLWIHDDNGESRLIKLTELGIGALYLGHASTDFSLTDQANQEQGQIRRSGVYLREDGQVGTLQQLDLVV